MRFKTKLKPSFTLIDMTPLVDVVFLMLIFFIISSEILPLKSLYIEHPQIEREDDAVTTRLILVMDAQHVLYLGSKKNIVDIPSLDAALKKEHEALTRQNPETPPTLVLSIDKRVDYDSFLKILSIAKESFSSIRLVYDTSLSDS
ncbi:ExbD/TolR family protein [Estrella lausannensis]|uniref:Biopolymer transport protein ExbD n=1 Tax=Estrella lausannensis TaxID=483423 RepID=A0A0H5DP25_9BACT|nr:biopolymer transporter ExbD [Estrella lausannensis]CRX37643.1 Biopolymer transport protein ExbD [Estrella lausannensis]